MAIKTEAVGSGSSLFMSPFPNVTNNDMSDMLGDVAMVDILSPNAVKSIAEAAKTESSEREESEKENVAYQQIMSGYSKSYGLFCLR